MAYNKEEILERAKAATAENQLIEVEEVISYLPCSKSTFYSFFPFESEELDAIKEIIYSNKVKMNTGLRKKWYDSDNATVQIALMKMICSEDQAARLNGSNQKIDVTTGGEKLNTERPVYHIHINGQVKDPDNA